MAMILSEKYVGPGAAKVFWLNRFLKLFPVYWFVLIATVLISIGYGVFTHNFLVLQPLISSFPHLSSTTKVFLFFSNSALFGQDLAMFLGLNNAGNLYFIRDFRLSSPPVYSFLFVPQAWTIEIEMLFYLLAPFLVKLRTRYLLSGIFILLLIRIYFYRVLGLSFDPWTYRFFPLELTFFFSGILSFRLFGFIQKKAIIEYEGYFLGFILCFVLTYQFIPSFGYLKQAFFYFAVFLSIPFIFNKTKRSSFDRQIGELSYPVYLSHFLIIRVFSLFLELDNPFSGVWVLTSTLLFSLIVNRFITRNLEKLRVKKLATLVVPGNSDTNLHIKGL